MPHPTWKLKANNSVSASIFPYLLGPLKGTLIGKQNNSDIFDTVNSEVTEVLNESYFLDLCASIAFPKILTDLLP